MSSQPASFSSADAPIGAVLFDLDDTLFPQESWLAGAWDAVARRAALGGIDYWAFRGALELVAAEGSDKGRIIDRALELIGVEATDVASLVDAFRSYEAPALSLFVGVRTGLATLASHVGIALATDGDPRIQRSKLNALEIEHLFSTIVISDEMGRECRKPHPAALLEAASRLGVPPAACVYVGDRPEKDVAAAIAARMRSIRVRCGEYSRVADVPPAWLSVRRTADAIDVLLERVTAATAHR